MATLLQDLVPAPTEGVVFTVANTFTAGEVIYRNNTSFGLSEPNDLKFGAMIVLEASPSSIRVAVEPGLYKLPGHQLGEIGDILFLEAPGQLTTSDQVLPQIPLVRVHDADTILLLQASGG